MFGMLKKSLKMLTNKKVLVVLALLSVVVGVFLYMKSQKAIVAQSDVDDESVEQQIMETVLAMTPESVEEETKDLGQAVQAMPSAPDSTENFTDGDASGSVVGASASDNFAPI